jgi:hypothetical protein
MSNQYLPGLPEEGEEVDVTAFPRKRYVGTAKWWWRPICWILRKPTSRTIYR